MLIRLSRHCLSKNSGCSILLKSVFTTSLHWLSVGSVKKQWNPLIIGPTAALLLWLTTAHAPCKSLSNDLPGGLNSTLAKCSSGWPGLFAR